MGTLGAWRKGVGRQVGLGDKCNSETSVTRSQVILGGDKWNSGGEGEGGVKGLWAGINATQEAEVRDDAVAGVERGGVVLGMVAGWAGFRFGPAAGSRPVALFFAGSWLRGLGCLRVVGTGGDAPPPKRNGVCDEYHNLCVVQGSVSTS